MEMRASIFVTAANSCSYVHTVLRIYSTSSTLSGPPRQRAKRGETRFRTQAVKMLLSIGARAESMPPGKTLFCRYVMARWRRDVSSERSRLFNPVADCVLHMRKSFFWRFAV